MHIVERYNLHMEDIKWPPRAQHNVLHSMIITKIMWRDEFPPFPARPVLPTAAANMVNRLLDMVDILSPHTNATFQEMMQLVRVLAPRSAWGFFRGVFTGRCKIDDQTTCDLVDRWACHGFENDNDNEWGVAMESARECIADANDIIRKAPAVAKAEERGNGVEKKPEIAINEITDLEEIVVAVSDIVVGDVDSNSGGTEQDVTATGATKRTCGKSTRRRMRERDISGMRRLED